MPLHDFRCHYCDKTEERYWVLAPPDYCEECGWPLEMLFHTGRPPNVGTGGVFPFDTPHVHPDGKPMTINDMGHLRKVERDYGVVLSAFSNDPSNTVDAIPNPPAYKGKEAVARLD